MSGFRIPDYLDHIHEAASDACSFVDGMTEDEFFTDKRTQNAVVMCLIIIGEAAGKVIDRYSNFAGRHTDIPWHVMRGMRNRMAHGYFEIDLVVVWDTVNNILPGLVAKLALIRAADATGEDDSGREDA